MSKRNTTRVTTSYARTFTKAEIRKAAIAAFIEGLGGDAGIEAKGIKPSAIKVDSYGGEVTVSANAKLVVQPATGELSLPVESEETPSDE